MKRVIASAVLVLTLTPTMALGLSSLSSNVTTATVLIVNYNSDGNFVGWGSGFFVDEGIVVTNKHVLAAGAWHRVYATTVDEKVDLNCYKAITKSDVKLNLDDDVAYMRVFLPCTHSVMRFADDPAQNAPISVAGYIFNGSVSSSLQLTVTSGTVTGQTEDGWLATDAMLDKGNSGGPVVDGTEVVGVAVAKGVDAEGNFLEGYFIPSSVIYRGLLNANDSDFGYTPQSFSRSSTSSVSTRSSQSSSSSSSSRSSRLSIPRPMSSARSSASPLQQRTCTRVERYRKDPGVFKRLNERLMKRYGFRCA